MKRVFRANSERIDFAMTDQNVSAAAIARAAGHSDHSYIARMRKGLPTARSASLRTAEATSRMLGLPMDYLFTEVSPSTGRPIASASDSQTLGMEGAA